MNNQKNLIAKHFGLRGIALFEAGKGLLAVIVAMWLLSLLHKDIQNVAEHLLRCAPHHPGQSSLMDRWDHNLCHHPLCRSCWTLAGKAVGGMVCADQWLSVYSYRNLRAGPSRYADQVGCVRNESLDRGVSGVVVARFT
jgi:hypothetical protein